MSEENEEKMYNKETLRTIVVVSVLITFIITFCLTAFVYYKYLEKNDALVAEYESSGDIGSDLDVLRTYLEKKYKGEIDEDAMYQSALKGYVEGLGDVYTTYMTADELESLTSELDNFVGIGIYMTQDKNTNRTVIISPIEDTPAEAAGIKSGDIILKVDEEDVTTKGSDYVASKVKGREGTTVKLTLLRGDEEIEMFVERAKINANKVKYELLDDNVGYIEIPSFTETCDEEVEEAYNDLKSQGMTSLILDLRDNTGGYVESALNIADLFINAGETLLITEDKDGYEELEKATREVIIDIPTVVLVNEYSASASEILSGCLKDYEVATIVGTTTYGKGVIQAVYDGILGEEIGGALKVTIAEYFTPKKNEINHVGVTPDVEVELDVDVSEVVTKENDNQLKKGIEILLNK